jgi:hypothetical protein
MKALSIVPTTDITPYGPHHKSPYAVVQPLNAAGVVKIRVSGTLKECEAEVSRGLVKPQFVTRDGVTYPREVSDAITEREIGIPRADWFKYVKNGRTIDMDDPEWRRDEWWPQHEALRNRKVAA